MIFDMIGGSGDRTRYLNHLEPETSKPRGFTVSPLGGQLHCFRFDSPDALHRETLATDLSTILPRATLTTGIPRS